jgi:hypothetical protein
LIPALSENYRKIVQERSIWHRMNFQCFTKKNDCAFRAVQAAVRPRQAFQRLRVSRHAFYMSLQQVYGFTKMAIQQVRLGQVVNRRNAIRVASKRGLKIALRAPTFITFPEAHREVIQRECASRI